jgi:hypothetical protein
MIGDVGSDSSQAVTIKFSDALFPIAATILRPLKRKVYYPPRLAEKRRRL